MGALMAGRVVRKPFARHPRLFVWGLLEARLQRADVTILGGLNENAWPPEAKASPWMSRPMMRAFGLPQPERRIGLTAHDFTQAFSGPEVVLTTFETAVPEGCMPVMAIGRADGSLWVGRVDGGSPHLLTGHQGPIWGLAISPDGRWIASSGEDKTLRLWPMPDLDRPPLHTLPLEQLLAKLRSLTNLHAVEDPESSTGWNIEIGPFPGWEEVPTW